MEEFYKLGLGALRVIYQHKDEIIDTVSDLIEDAIDVITGS